MEKLTTEFTIPLIYLEAFTNSLAIAFLLTKQPTKNSVDEKTVFKNYFRDIKLDSKGSYYFYYMFGPIFK